MILFKSAIREAVLSGRLAIEDDNGNPFPGWKTYWSPGHETLEEGFIGGDPVGLQPASIDLHLGNHWLVPKPNAEFPEPKRSWFSRTFGRAFHTDRRYLDTAKPIEYLEVFKDDVYIAGRSFLLARTQEVVGLPPELFGKVDGRSSFGRTGVFIENAGVIDNGFKGSITLEVFNPHAYPVKLYAGTRCCQICLFEGKGSAEGGYQGSYQGQMGTRGSMLYKTVPGGAR